MTHMIYVGYSDRVPQYFRELVMVGRVENPWFREYGLPIWFGSYPTPLLFEDWEAAWQRHVVPFQRKTKD
jgi:hypothetical protein